MRSPQTVPLVIQHRSISRPASSIPIPAPSPGPPHSRAEKYRPQSNDDADADMDMDVDMESPPPLTTAQSLDDGDMLLLTPPSHLLFGGPLTPMHVGKGQGLGHVQGQEADVRGDKGKGRAERGSPLMHTPPEVCPACPRELFGNMIAQLTGQILHRILCHAAGEDVRCMAKAAGTCKELRSFIYEVRLSTLPR